MSLSRYEILLEAYRNPTKSNIEALDKLTASLNRLLEKLKSKDHETTVALCKKAQEEGVGIDDIIKREIEPDLKMIKFI